MAMQDIIREVITNQNIFKNKFVLIEEKNSQLAFLGIATKDAQTSDSSWRIGRILKQGNVYNIQFANSGSADQIWDDRASLFSGGEFFNQFSILFDGINDYVTFGDVYNYTAAQAFSVSIWVKPQNFSAVRLFVGKTTVDANVYGWRIGLDTDGKIITQMRGPSQANAFVTWPTALAADTWTHIAWTFSGSGNQSGQSLYINSVKESFTPSSSSITNMASNGHPLTIGRAPANYFSGKLNQFAVWDKALTQADVDEIYNSASPPDLTTLAVSGNLESWWHLGTDDVYPTALDQKGVADGTLTNINEEIAFSEDVP